LALQEAEHKADLHRETEEADAADPCGVVLLYSESHEADLQELEQEHADELQELAQGHAAAIHQREGELAHGHAAALQQRAQGHAAEQARREHGHAAALHQREDAYTAGLQQREGKYKAELDAAELREEAVRDELLTTKVLALNPTTLAPRFSRGGASLIRKRLLLGPYSRPMPRALW
jgi:hypothetical protein